MEVLGAIIAFLGASLLAMASNWIGMFRFPSAELHWTERARRLYPIRRSAALNIWLFPAIIGFAHLVATEGEDPFFSGVLIVAAWAGTILGTYPFDKKLFPQFTFKKWLRIVYTSWLLRFGIFGILILGGVIMPEDFGWQTILIGCAVFGFWGSLHFGLWLGIMHKTGLLVPAKETDGLSAIVRRTSERMQIPYRRVWIKKTPFGYAAALPLTGDLIFSEGMIVSQSETEIAAICAHELAHLSEPRRAIYARVLASLVFCPLIFIRPMEQAFDFSGIAIVLVPLMLMSTVVRRSGRKMEVRADAAANANTEEAGVYARALEKLYRMNLIPAAMSGKDRTHPNLYDRMVAAGVTPDYPRPKPPGLLHWTSTVMYLVLVILIVMLLNIP